MKRIKWESPGLFGLSTSGAHGAIDCATGIDVGATDCTTGSGAVSSCQNGWGVASSGVLCHPGSSAAVSRG